ncbi:hypothetical protein D9M69_686370 [compost metagenome]
MDFPFRNLPGLVGLKLMHDAMHQTHPDAGSDVVLQLIGGHVHDPRDGREKVDHFVVPERILRGHPFDDLVEYAESVVLEVAIVQVDGGGLESCDRNLTDLSFEFFNVKHGELLSQT